MVLSMVPGNVTLGSTESRGVSRFNPAILADLTMRGFAISFLTVICGVFLSSFFSTLRHSRR
jgi:hypothetical protein